MYLLMSQHSFRVVPTLRAAFPSFICATALVTNSPQAMHTEAAGAGDTFAAKQDVAGNIAEHDLGVDKDASAFNQVHQHCY